jgi:acetyltransferase-like isoleucine patch superfamily enzyme
MISLGFNFVRFLFRKMFYFVTTVAGRIQCFLAGAKIGSGISFFGIPYIQKARTGKLNIGKKSSFLSTATSNLIGVNRPCILSVNNNASLEIGNYCGFSGTVIGCFKDIIIEDNVRCGANTTITDSDWHLDDPRSGPVKPIHIHKNVWLGTGVLVLKGVTIGENSVIGAGSVVVKDIPANVIAAGNPCKVIRSIEKE